MSHNYSVVSFSGLGVSPPFPVCGGTLSTQMVSEERGTPDLDLIIHSHHHHFTPTLNSGVFAQFRSDHDPPLGVHGLLTGRPEDLPAEFPPGRILSAVLPAYLRGPMVPTILGIDHQMTILTLGDDAGRRQLAAKRLRQEQPALLVHGAGGGS